MNMRAMLGDEDVDDHEISVINSKAIANVVKTYISRDVRTFPSSFALSSLRWEGSSVFSWESLSSAIDHTLEHFLHRNYSSTC